MKDIMVDLETLGTTHNAVITQIGACYFDRYTGELGNEFNMNVQINSCLDAGLTVTSGAIKFWMERTGRATWLKEPVKLSLALAKFGEFIQRKKDTILWCHATFDAVILANAYHAIGQGLPYSYRNVRDIRTLVDLANIKYKKEEGADDKSHDALEDCWYQIDYCSQCFNKLRGNDKKVNR